MFNQSSEYVHNNGIKELYPDVNGTQLCFIDSKSDTYVFDPINETVYAVPDCPDNIDGILWDQNIFERAIFAIYSKSIIVTYIFVKYFVEGKYLHRVFYLIISSKENLIYSYEQVRK